MSDWTWGADSDAWDHESGEPGISLFGNAIQVWSVMQGSRHTSVAEAAMTFNVPPERIVEAVNAHAWMFISVADVASCDYSTVMIEHDGE